MSMITDNYNYNIKVKEKTIQPCVYSVSSTQDHALFHCMQ
jgi:hypothetical protein